ncbi:2,3-bisphosphoglycerate-dependent phosphoglycerate mutase [Streptomyces sp. NPDC055722]
MSHPTDSRQGTLILLRHGQSEANASAVFGGWADYRLTQHGEEQATDAARLITQAGLLPDMVHTSLLHRGDSPRPPGPLLDTGTAHMAAQREAVRSPHRTQQAGDAASRRRRTVRELAPLLHGRPPPLPADQLALLRADPRYARLPDEVIPAVESFREVRARVAPYWSDLLAPRLAQGATTLLVAHSNSLRALVSLLDRQDEPPFRVLDIPTAKPLLYAITAGFQPSPPGGHDLAPDPAHAAAQAVAAEGHH